MKKKLKIYMHTLISDCMHTEDKDQKSYCDKVIARIDDIIENAKKKDLKKVIKSFIETLEIRADTAPDINCYRFHKEVIKKLKKIKEN